MSMLPKIELDDETEVKISNISMKYKKQIEKFKEVAREHNVDEDEKAFDDKLRRISKQQPKKEKPAQSAGFSLESMMKQKLILFFQTLINILENRKNRSYGYEDPQENGVSIKDTYEATH